MMRTLRALLTVEAVSLLVAAAIHAGIVIRGPFDQAAIYESSLGILLAVGLGLTFLGFGVARIAGLVTQAFALVGACIGLFLVSRGVAPNTPLDIVYHVVLIGLLIVGLVVAWRLPRPEGDPR